MLALEGTGKKSIYLGSNREERQRMCRVKGPNVCVGGSWDGELGEGSVLRSLPRGSSLTSQCPCGN